MQYILKVIILISSCILLFTCHKDNSAEIEKVIGNYDCHIIRKTFGFDSSLLVPELIDTNLVVNIAKEGSYDISIKCANPIGLGGILELNANEFYKYPAADDIIKTTISGYFRGDTIVFQAYNMFTKSQSDSLFGSGLKIK